MPSITLECDGRLEIIQIGYSISIGQWKFVPSVICVYFSALTSIENDSAITLHKKKSDFILNQLKIDYEWFYKYKSGVFRLKIDRYKSTKSIMEESKPNETVSKEVPWLLTNFDVAFCAIFLCLHESMLIWN